MIRKLAKERSRSVDNRGHGDVNRVYPSRESYLNTLYEVIFGYVESNRMITMEEERNRIEDDQRNRAVYPGLYVPEEPGEYGGCHQ